MIVLLVLERYIGDVNAKLEGNAVFINQHLRLAAEYVREYMPIQKDNVSCKETVQ
jgi:hypothetical protein